MNIEKLGQELPGSTVITWDGIVHIFGDNLARTVYVTAQGDDQDKPFTLDDAHKIAKKEGMTGVIHVLCENTTHGEIYSYGNYLRHGWILCGTTMGYA